MFRAYYCDCGQKMKVPEHALGQSGKCVKCGQSVTATLKNTQPYDVKPASGLGSESLRTNSSKTVASVENDRIHFLCLKCGMSLSFPLSSCGNIDKCTSCGFGFRVPHAPDYYKALLSAACTGLSKAWDLQATGEDERAQKGFDLAKECVCEVLEDPILPLPIKADALCLQGMLQKSVGHFAQAQTSLEKGLALGQANGFAMDLDQGWLYGDTLADVYDAILLSAVNEDRFDEAEEIASKLKSIIKYLRVRSTEDSALLKHDSARLVSKGIIAKHHSEFDLALRLFRRVIDGPHKEYLLSSNQGKFRWLLGLAYMDIGQIDLRVFYRVDEAIRVLQEALQCFSKDDEQFSSVQALLAEARSEPQLPTTLKEKLNAVRSGDCETRVAAIKMMLQSDDLAPLRQYLPAVKSAVLQAMRQGDSRVQNCGALLLAELGDESDAIVKVLIHQLSLPQSEHETRDSVLAYKTQALFGLCHLRNRNDFVNDIITAAEHDDDETVRQRAIFALAAIGHEAAVRFVTRLAADGNDAAVFALDCAKKDVEWLRTAVLCGREKVPGAALSTYGNGWNGLRWGATVDEFRRRFPEATLDANKWRTGEGKEEIAGMPMMTGYMFNKGGQFELVGFDPGPGETVFPDPLFDTFGTPDGLKGTSWSYGTLVLKCTEAVIVLVNTAFSDDPVASWEGWTGRKSDSPKPEAPHSFVNSTGVPQRNGSPTHTPAGGNSMNLNKMGFENPMQVNVPKCVTDEDLERHLSTIRDYKSAILALTFDSGSPGSEDSRNYVFYFFAGDIDPERRPGEILTFNVRFDNPYKLCNVANYLGGMAFGAINAPALAYLDLWKPGMMSEEGKVEFTKRVESKRGCMGVIVLMFLAAGAVLNFW